MDKYNNNVIDVTNTIDFNEAYVPFFNGIIRKLEIKKRKNTRKKLQRVAAFAGAVAIFVGISTHQHRKNNVGETTLPEEQIEEVITLDTIDETNPYYGQIEEIKAKIKYMEDNNLTMENYIVDIGDSLSEIAAKTSNNYDEIERKIEKLKEINNLPDTRIQAGQELLVDSPVLFKLKNDLKELEKKAKNYLKPEQIEIPENSKTI